MKKKKFIKRSIYASLASRNKIIIIEFTTDEIKRIFTIFDNLINNTEWYYQAEILLTQDEFLQEDNYLGEEKSSFLTCAEDEVKTIRDSIKGYLDNL